MMSIFYRTSKGAYDVREKSFKSDLLAYGKLQNFIDIFDQMHLQFTILKSIFFYLFWWEQKEHELNIEEIKDEYLQQVSDISVTLVTCLIRFQNIYMHKCKKYFKL